MYGLPLALLAADRLIRGGSYRVALALAVWVAVLAYTSGYLVVFAAFMLAIAFVTRMPEWLPRWRAILPQIVTAAIVAAVLIVPVYLPYRRVAREQQMVRTLDAVNDFSATLPGYLATPGRLHFADVEPPFLQGPDR